MLLEMDAVSKQFGSTMVLHSITFSVAENERVCILGPSGCGKTTTLNIIGGFLVPDAGTLRLSGRIVNHLPAYRRETATVFQDYALFPHLSVAENILFGLRVGRVPGGEARSRLNWALELTRLHGLERRYPRQLSGGQRQRVALARALVMKPKLLLLDEPLSNLDANLRVEMRRELLRIQRETGIASILVTHDQHEAFVLAEKIVLMERGRIVQVGTPAALFNAPETVFAARFLGFENIFRTRGGEPSSLTLAGLESAASAPGAEQQVYFGVRADRVVLGPNAQRCAVHFEGVVSEVEYTGEETTYFVHAGPLTIVARGSEAIEHRRGTRVSVGWDPAAQWMLRDDG